MEFESQTPKVERKEERKMKRCINFYYSWMGNMWWGKYTIEIIPPVRVPMREGEREKEHGDKFSANRLLFATLKVDSFK